MEIETTRFGKIEVSPDKIITFPEGLLGFEKLKKYALLPLNDNPAFTWLQSVEDPVVAFLILDPFLFFADYSVKLDDNLCSELSIDDNSEVIIQVIANIPKSGVKDITANLVGPLVINVKEKLGKQIILQNTEYGTRHRVFNNDTTGGEAAEQSG